MTSTSTRNAWQCAAVWAPLVDIEEFRTTARIHSDLCQVSDKVGFAMVYRAFRTANELGDPDVSRTPGGEAVYRMCFSTHHHHLVCRSRGIMMEILVGTVEPWVNQVAQEYGFTDMGRNLEIFGLCRNCPS